MRDDDKLPTLEQSAENVRRLTEELKSVEQLINSLSKQLAAANERRDQIAGRYQSAGSLRIAEGELQLAQRIDRDQRLTPVVWLAKPPYDHNHYVIDRVTENRIYVRVVGRDRSEIFRRDGTSLSSYSNSRAIDIKKTFGSQPAPLSVSRRPRRANNERARHSQETAQ